MKKKNKMSKIEDVFVEGQGCTDFTIIGDELFSDEEIAFDLVDDLPEIIDEDMLYEEYRDHELFDAKTGQPKQRYK